MKLILVRTATAVPRRAWRGEAQLRPLADAGIRQASWISFGKSGASADEHLALISSTASADGAPAGNYEVLLGEPPMPGGWDVDEQGMPPQKIPKKYKDYSTSGISLVVSPDGENRLDILIERP